MSYKADLEIQDTINGTMSLGVDYYKGDKGDDGYTPIKGKDYFTQEEIEKIEQDTINKISTDGFAKSADLADVATSGSYKDLKDKPEPIDLTPYPTKDEVEQSYAKKADLPEPYELPIASDTVLGGIKVGSGLSINQGVLSANGGGVADSVDWSKVQNKPDFAIVATSGDYNDLSNKPSIPSVDGLASKDYVDSKIGDIVIPSKTSELENDSGYLTEHQDLSAYAKKTEIPTNVSAFTNDAGYLTEHQSLVNYALKSEIPDTANLATKTEVQEVENKIPEPYILPMATTSTLGGVKPDGTTITVADGVISAVGGSSGRASADEETIITNAEGKLETAIGGKWVDGLVDGPVIIDINTTSTDVSSILTYDIMQELISKGDNLRAILSSGFGTEKNCLVEIDTSTTNTYKLTCKYTITSVEIVYTGIGTSDNWSCTRSFQGGSTSFSSGNSFYYMVNGKVPSPFKSANFLPIGRDFKVEDDKLALRYLKRTPDGGYYLSQNNDGSGVKDMGENSFAVGQGNNYASGICSYSFGFNASSQGDFAFSLGNQTYGKNNDYVFVTGMITQATKNCQFISGNYSNWYDINKAKGAQIFGQGCISSSDWSMTAGKYNANDTNKEYAHVVGNGTSNTSRSNAYTLDWSGNGTFAGTVSSSTGADYAEYFEWKDGNPNNEDRVGYIVTLDGNKIVKANTGDDILGICSGTAMVLGDSAEWNWNKRYLTDDFGRIIYEDRMEHHEAIYNPDGELIKEAWDEEVHAPKINPEYNSDTPYTKRADRPEWQIVGMMGKLYVRDDGSCVVNGYADVKDGIAIKATGKTNMRVMERVNDSIIRVLMK